MTELIRQGSHGNQINVVFIPEYGLLRKFTNNRESFRYLKSEKNGYLWYAKRANFLYKYPSLKFYNTYNYARLDIPLFDGINYSYKQCLRITFPYIDRAFNHYIKVWPRNKISPIHGDLTLSNILFSQSNTVFIDWEHFNLNGEFWGFDLAYLLISSLVVLDNNYSIPDNESFRLFTILWKKLVSMGLPNSFVHRPIKEFRNLFQKSSNWKYILLDSPRKLYPVSLPYVFSSEIDDLIATISYK